MAKLAHELTTGIRGKIGNLVYQRVKKGAGNIPLPGDYDLQLRTEVPRTDAQSPLQLLYRARLAAATLAYQALSPVERETWKAAAHGTAATGYNLFVRDFCRSHSPEEYA